MSRGESLGGTRTQLNRQEREERKERNAKKMVEEGIALSEGIDCIDLRKLE